LWLPEWFLLGVGVTLIDSCITQLKSQGPSRTCRGLSSARVYASITSFTQPPEIHIPPPAASQAMPPARQSAPSAHPERPSLTHKQALGPAATASLFPGKRDDPGAKREPSGMVPGTRPPLTCEFDAAWRGERSGAPPISRWAIEKNEKRTAKVNCWG